MSALDLRRRLDDLGLAQYLSGFIAEGFDTWETLLDITESDLSSLNVKLGHRRKLQRAIAESRPPSDLPSFITQPKAPGFDSTSRSETGVDGRAGTSGEAQGSSAGRSTKRKYRRHPKPDEHAPERPASAYVIFSNQMRESLKGQDLSFTETAKIVGERWQVLSLDAREVFERQAASAKEKYYAELAEYKKTPEYAQYQEYLVEFKAKHGAPPSETKRSKLETESSLSTRSSSHDHMERDSRRTFSEGDLEEPSFGHRRSPSSPPSNRANHPPGAYRQLPSTKSSGMYNLSSANSPTTTGYQSPLAASPAAYRPKDSVLDSYAYPQNMSGDGPANSIHYASNTSPGTHPSTYNSFNVASLPNRRSYQESPIAPPPALTHDDTTLSSNESLSHYAVNSTQLLPPIDAPKALRVLPQPVPTHNAMPSPLDTRRSQLPPVTSQPDDIRNNPSLAALLHAGQLAREADSKNSEPSHPP